MCFRPPSVDEGGEAVCASCGESNASGSSVCASCGKPLLTVPAAAMGNAGAPPVAARPGAPKPPSGPRPPAPHTK